MAGRCVWRIGWVLWAPSSVLRHQSGLEEAPANDSEENREKGPRVPSSRHGSRCEGGPSSQECSLPWRFHPPQVHSSHGLQVSLLNFVYFFY